MNPAETTRSASYDATDAVSAASQSSRLSKSPTRCTKVGTPARSARASPSMSVTVGADADHLRAVRRIARGVEQGLEVGTGTGHQDDHTERALGHGRES